jgi:hypothetical protein
MNSTQEMRALSRIAHPASCLAPRASNYFDAIFTVQLTGTFVGR